MRLVSPGKIKNQLRIILGHLLRIARLRSDLCNSSLKKNGVRKLGITFITSVAKLKPFNESQINVSHQINKDTVYKEAPSYACFFLNDVNGFLRSFSKYTSHNKYTLFYDMVIFWTLEKNFFEKWNNGKSKTRKSWKSWIYYSEFSILAVGQNRKLGFKNLGKMFSRFPRFLSFRPGPILCYVA